MSSVSPILRFEKVRAGSLARSFTPMLDEIAADPSPVRTRRPNTEQELAKIREEARKEGFEVGYGDGYREGLQVGRIDGHAIGKQEGYDESRALETEALNSLILELDEMGGRMQVAISRWSEEAEAKVADLAIDAVRRVLNAELQLNREAVTGIVAQALAQVTRGSEAVIRVNPFDLPLVDQKREALLLSAASLQKLTIVEDPTVLGGCVIETPAGIVDAQIETQLELLQSTLEESA